MSKKRFLAKVMQRSGVLRALEWTGSRLGLLVLNYHRVGEAQLTSFDRGVFSATEDELDQQIGYLQRHFPVVCGEELDHLISGQTKPSRMHVALTFDDGYLDNYTKAYPVLRSHGVGAAFLLVSDYVGSTTVPWWDEMAYLVRHTKRDRLVLRGAKPLILTRGEDREAAIHAVLRHAKRPGTSYMATLLDELRDQANCALPTPRRRFLSWDEAREMRRSGMVIGSHTKTHRVLGQISAEEQRWELAESKKQIEREMREPIATLAYPVGTPGTFDHQTEAIAGSLGYRTSFSFYGGVNRPRSISRTNLLRNPGHKNLLQFRMELRLRAAGLRWQA